ncbi:hypothetical protein MNBD_GAMMA26-1348 [hydrothermal vent metagenome]|uniref:Uncharacterized protein n=1 Tax=hydrothermal vent metagenome TaxID=652676 RepID=A0A3B1BXM7_9ZZZZ
MSVITDDITKLKGDIQNLHEDLKVAMDHLEFHLGVKRMDERDLDQMSEHLNKLDTHMAQLVAHIGSLEEKHK